MKPKYFKSAAGFRTWLEANHDRATEQWLGFYKKSSGRAGLTYAEALDEALCFGWIDGLKKRVDDLRFKQRFTPRKPGSNWSFITIGHVQRLTKAGRMKPAGLQALAARTKSDLAFTRSRTNRARCRRRCNECSPPKRPPGYSSSNNRPATVAWPPSG